MKIFGLINKNSGPGFHRIHVPLLLMPDVDCYITNAVSEEDFEKRKPDVIYYNRLISDEVLALQSKYHFRVVVDVDDYWHLDPHHIMFRHSRTNSLPRHQEKNIRNADLVTCTHERLAEQVSKLNKNVIVLPNAIPNNAPDLFPVVRTQSAKGHKRIFWQGSVTHEKDLDLLRSTVKKLDRERFMMVMVGYTQQIEWERMADCFTNYRKMPGVVLPGAGTTEYYQNYQYADVCVVPLLSTKFNCYKSNLKILEAAHSGLPVIASNVHPYKNMEGVMYVDSKGDWLKWLEMTDEWVPRAELLKTYCDREFNFTEINLKRKRGVGMRQESIDFLEANRHHYDLLVRAQYVKHLDSATREGLLQVIRIEFDPGYIGDLWCPTCVATMLTYAYVQFDQWLARQPAIK